MIRHLLSLYSNRHINRGTRQLRAFVTATNARDELLLTPDMALSSNGIRVRARRLRSRLAKLDYAGRETKALRDHRLALEVALLRGETRA